MWPVWCLGAATSLCLACCLAGREVLFLIRTGFTADLAPQQGIPQTTLIKAAGGPDLAGEWNRVSVRAIDEAVDYSGGCP